MIQICVKGHVLLNRQFGFLENRKREEIVKERCIDLEKYFDIFYAKKKDNQTRWIDSLKVVTFYMVFTGQAIYLILMIKWVNNWSGLQKRLMGVKYWHFYLLGMDDITQVPRTQARYKNGW